MVNTISHISETAGISRFEPRATISGGAPIVWGIDEEHLRNYLLPRECPRVTFYAKADSTPEDIDRFLLSSRAVVALESVWLDRIRTATLYRYILPADPFECIDPGAGYYATESPVEPTAIEIFDDLFAELVRRDVEVRLLTNLWHLHDAVAASTLQFSMIRMRNAAPRS